MGTPLQTAKIRLLLADDHQVILDSLERMFLSEPDLEVVGKAIDGQGAVELARALRPDVALIDERMPILSGVEATRQITTELPHIRVIGFSANDDPSWIDNMAAAGAEQCISKGSDPDNLIAAIRARPVK